MLVSEENANKVIKALNQFGMAEIGLKQEDFLKPDSFIQIGYPPNRIDMVMSCDGVDFESCYESRIE